MCKHWQFTHKLNRAQRLCGKFLSDSPAFTPIKFTKVKFISNSSTISKMSRTHVPLNQGTTMFRL